MKAILRFQNMSIVNLVLSVNDLIAGMPSDIL